MILKRPFLSRRAVLRGAGATLALPLMEIMESRSLAKGAACLLYTSDAADE